MPGELLTLSAADETAVRLSLRVAFWATLCSLPLALGVSMLLERGRFLGRSAIDLLVQLPLVLPPVVTGYALLLLFGRRGPLGRLLEEHAGIVLGFRWTGAALACAVMGFPLMVRAMRLAIASVDRGLEEAAATLGAPPAWVFFSVTLPLILPGVVAGAFLSFARSLGEFGATITFVSNIPGETQTLAAAIYTWTQVPGGDANALRLTAVAVLLSASALALSEWLSRRVASWVRGL